MLRAAFWSRFLDVNHICETWGRALLEGARVRTNAVMRLPFDTGGGGEAMVAFRCRRCHSDGPHYGQVLSVAVITETPA